MRTICVAGARPNYMKVKPVMDALEQQAQKSSWSTLGSTMTPQWMTSSSAISAFASLTTSWRGFG